MTDQSDSTQTKKDNGRSPFLLLGGAILLGLGGGAAHFWQWPVQQEDSVLQQIPDGAGEAKVAQISPDSNSLLEVGDTARNFYLQDLEGNTSAWKIFEDNRYSSTFGRRGVRHVVLKCLRLQATQDAHQDDGLVILAVNDQETPDEMCSVCR